MYGWNAEVVPVLLEEAGATGALVVCASRRPSSPLACPRCPATISRRRRRSQSPCRRRRSPRAKVSSPSARLCSTRRRRRRRPLAAAAVLLAVRSQSMEAFTLQVALSGATFSRQLSAFTQTGVEQTLEMLEGLQATTNAEPSGWGRIVSPQLRFDDPALLGPTLINVTVRQAGTYAFVAPETVRVTVPPPRWRTARVRRRCRRPSCSRARPPPTSAGRCSRAARRRRRRSRRRPAASRSRSCWSAPSGAPHAGDRRRRRVQRAGADAAAARRHSVGAERGGRLERDRPQRALDFRPRDEAQRVGHPHRDPAAAGERLSAPETLSLVLPETALGGNRPRRRARRRRAREYPAARASAVPHRRRRRARRRARGRTRSPLRRSTTRGRPACARRRDRVDGLRGGGGARGRRATCAAASSSDEASGFNAVVRSLMLASLERGDRAGAGGAQSRAAVGDAAAASRSTASSTLTARSPRRRSASRSPPPRSRRRWRSSATPRPSTCCRRRRRCRSAAVRADGSTEIAIQADRARLTVQLNSDGHVHDRPRVRRRRPVEGVHPRARLRAERAVRLEQHRPERAALVGHPVHRRVDRPPEGAAVPVVRHRAARDDRDAHPGVGDAQQRRGHPRRRQVCHRRVARHRHPRRRRRPPTWARCSARRPAR